jgi:hypothetical protein
VAVPFRSQPPGKFVMISQSQTLAWQVDDDGLAHLGHIVDERGNRRCGEKIDRPLCEPMAQKLHNRVAAYEIPYPHEGDDEDGRR